MQRKNKEINIFSMSALDLFASALGAFILIALIALPYYLKTDKSLVVEARELKKELKQAKSDLENTKKALKKSQKNLGDCKKEVAQCKTKLSKTFLSVLIMWGTEKIDIDLHVFDPEGNEFYYSKNNRDRRDYPNSSASLTWDVLRGPGVELWESPAPTPGIYTIRYNYYKGIAPTSVLGKVYYRSGAIDIRTISLSPSQKGAKTLAYKIRLKSDGTVEIL